MKFTLQNIGMIPDATVNLNGITVIAGENGTGKSTIEKAIALYFSSLNGLSDFIEEDRIQTVTDTMRSAGNDLDFMLKTLSGAKRRKNISGIAGMQERYAGIMARNDADDRSGEENITACLSEYVYWHAISYGITKEKLERSEDYQRWFEKTLDRLRKDFRYSDDEIGKQKVSNEAHAFFADQMIRFGTTDAFLQAEEDEGEKKNQMSFTRQARSAREVCSDLQMQIQVSESAVYIASPNVFDHLMPLDDEDLYRESLMALLSLAADQKSWNRQASDCIGMTEIEQEQSRRRCAPFCQRIEEVTGGKLAVTVANRLQFVPDRGGRNIEMANLSTGVKALSVLAYAMEHGCINDNTVLILDAPETNLHPKWQLLYAELLVRMQKEMGLKILITMHSPYFAKAIDLYSRKYHSEKDCSYYLTELDPDLENTAVVRDVTEEKRLIYAALAEPFHTLESLENGGD